MILLGMAGYLIEYATRTTCSRVWSVTMYVARVQLVQRNAPIVMLFLFATSAVTSHMPLYVGLCTAGKTRFCP